MKLKRIATAALTVGIAVSLVACSGGRGSSSGSGSSGGATDNKGALVGVAMPTKTSSRWIKDGNAVKADLEKAGYKVDLQYGADKIPQQVQQVGNMITKGAKVLIIAAINGEALSDQLDAAGKAGIKVIAYDRLINGNKNVDYYTTFDNYKVGVQQATSLLTGLGILDESGEKTGKKGPFNVELFAGSPDDNNATFFFNGAMATLKPYLEDGTLKVQSGQTGFSQVAILRWQATTAKARMQNLIAKSYSKGETVDGILSPYDGLSLGIISALKGSGYGSGSKELPVVTGQDAEAPSLKSILADEQYSTIFKDTRKLGHKAAEMADDLLSGTKPEVNDTKTYDNKVKVVPSYLFQSEIITKDNVKSAVIGSGYYSESDIK